MNKIILISLLVLIASCGGKHEKADLIGYLKGGSRNYGTFDCYGVPDNCSRDISVRKIYIASSDSLAGLLTAKADSSKALIQLFDQDLGTPDTYIYLVDLKEFSETFKHGFSAMDVYNFVKSSQLIARPISGVTGLEGFDPSVGGYFKDANGIYYFSEDQESSKDLESIGSRIDSTEVESIKDSLLSYGLSVERTEKLAKLMTSYKKISNKRALNASEKDVFTKELLGMTFDNAAKEMVENYDGLIETAAERNGTFPEAVKELVNSFLLR
jgi:hypothetical protein